MAIFALYYGKTPQYASALLRCFFLSTTKSISFLSAKGSFWIGNFVCGEVKNAGIPAYSEVFDEMAVKIYIQKPVDLYGAPPNRMAVF